jgi:dolichol-phosphate mannosyltransferase
MDKTNTYYELPQESIKALQALKGPIVIFGAGGFIGINLLKSFLLYRKDVYGITQDYLNNWRFIANNIPLENLRSCDVNQNRQLQYLLDELAPQTVINLAAYGAYSMQKEYNKIYKTNFLSAIDLLETLKQKGFDAYVHAGSSSEYGLNSAAPKEDAQLLSNSHYAVSKSAVFQAIQYYGKIESLPVVHLRLYSAYGPWEETNRLIPTLLSHARKGMLPKLVDKSISRDFIYINDVVQAFIRAAHKTSSSIQGEAINIGTGTKTTIEELSSVVKQICNLKVTPQFGSMPDRDWDLPDWYANCQKAEKELAFVSTTTLEEGLRKTLQWQQDIDYDNAFWNRNKKV